MPTTIAPADEKAAISNERTVRRQAHAGSGLKYRADIDGLRAVAVLSVLAFHIGLIGFKGGFVGVDVFFVISGYLISSIIFAEISGSRFTTDGETSSSAAGASASGSSSGISRTHVFGSLSESLFMVPDVFIAEPVGSCTDLVATVTYPLRRIYGEKFSISPLSVLIDPVRALRI